MDLDVCVRSSDTVLQLPVTTITTEHLSEIQLYASILLCKSSLIHPSIAFPFSVPQPRLEQPLAGDKGRGGDGHGSGGHGSGRHGDKGHGEESVAEMSSALPGCSSPLVL